MCSPSWRNCSSIRSTDPNSDRKLRETGTGAAEKEADQVNKMIAKRVFLVKLPVKSAHTGKMYKLFGIPVQL